MREVSAYLAQENLGDLASVVGVLIALLGFGLTLWGVWKSRTAAVRAERAATQVRERIDRYDTMTGFATALAIMEEIKRLHRGGAWQVLPDRYSAIRRLLASIASAVPEAPDHHRSALQAAIQHFADIEAVVERGLEAKGRPPSVAKLNRIVSTQVDRLQTVLIEMRQAVVERIDEQ